MLDIENLNTKFIGSGEYTDSKSRVRTFRQSVISDSPLSAEEIRAELYRVFEKRGRRR